MPAELAELSCPLDLPDINKLPVKTANQQIITEEEDLQMVCLAML